MLCCCMLMHIYKNAQEKLEVHGRARALFLLQGSGLLKLGLQQRNHWSENFKPIQHDCN